LKEAAKSIITAKNIAVICHIRPDCDTIGSGLGLRRILLTLGKGVTVHCSDPVPEKFAFFEDASAVTQKAIPAADLIISVDCSDSLRMGSFREAFLAHSNTVNIDHHVSNTREGKVNVVADEYSSSSELIYELCLVLKVPLTREIALPLYLGLSTDTGNFAHSNTNEHSLLTAAALKRETGDVSEYIYLLYKDNPKPRFVLMANVLKGARFFAEDRLCILTVTRESLASAGADETMTEGFVEQAVNCSPVEVGVCVLEHGRNTYKVSFRSKRYVDVSGVAGVFGGGGHVRASGCMLSGFYEDVIDKIVKAVTDRLTD